MNVAVGCVRDRGRRVAHSAIAFLALIAAGLWAPGAQAAETRSFVVSWFHTATTAYDGACPHGMNPEHVALWARSLKELGYSPADIDRLQHGQKINGRALQDIVRDRGRIKGMENTFAYPWSVPDPHVHVVEGKYAYGFNLDGRGAQSPNSFEDLDTHERGVNNELFRAYGCFNEFHVNLPDRPQYEANAWFAVAMTMPAWVMTVSGDDLSKDGDVTLTFARALERSMHDARGQILADATYRIDPNPQSLNVFRGHIKDHILSIEPADLLMQFEPHVLNQLKLLNTHLRFTLKPDGTLAGYIGGYTPWFDVFWIQSSIGYDAEESGVDLPGLWYALDRLADGPKDPKTGKSHYISGTFWIEAVPAIVVDPEHALAGLKPRMNSVQKAEIAP